MARIVVAGTFDPAFGRNRRLLSLLEKSGHEIEIVRAPLWPTDRVAIPNGGKATLLLRALAAYARLAGRMLRVRRGDLVLVCYPGWFDVVVLAPIARLRGMPVVFDIFISAVDTVVYDRKQVGEGSRLARFLLAADRASIRLASRVIADTPAHAEFFAELSGVARERFGVVWLGARDEVFRPRPDVRPVPGRVFFHGTFIALQGLDTIIRAAKLVEPDGITVRVAGTGQEQAAVDALMAELEPENVELVGRLPLERIPDEIAAATLCLGVFGTSGKAGRVVPNKVYECVAVGRPVLTGDTAAARSAFCEDEVAFCPPGDPAALAREMRRLVADDVAREAIARGGHARYTASYSSEPLRALLDRELAAVIPEA
jgi:glycosyltransferase involved in cell wall biosynthesis